MFFSQCGKGGVIKRAAVITCLMTISIGVILFSGCGETSVAGRYVNKESYIVLSKTGEFKEHVHRIPAGGSEIEWDINGTYEVAGKNVVLNADTESRVFPEGGRQEKWRIDGDLLRVPDDPLGEPFVKQ